MSDLSNVSPRADTGTIGDTGAMGSADASEEALRLDGNAASGMLAEIFMYDMTSAQGTCANCGHSGPLGALLMYGGQTGIILRCPTCDHVQLRIMHIPGSGQQRAGQYCLDMRGMTLLRIAPSSGV